MYKYKSVVSYVFCNNYKSVEVCLEYISVECTINKKSLKIFYKITPNELYVIWRTNLID